MDSRIVLFGSSGFVGSHVRKALGAADVVAPEWPAIDLAKPESLRGVMQPDDVVINAAGYASATDTTEQGLALFRSANVDGVRNLAEAAEEAGVAQLVHISSVAAMGRMHGERLTEEMSVPVASPYAESKLEGERILAGYSDRIPITILRPTSVFGEGRGLAGLLFKLASKGTVPLPGGGDARIPFTYIGNIAEAVRLSLGNRCCFGRTFIVGDEQSYPLRRIVSEIADSLGVSARIVAVPPHVAYFGAACFEKLASMRKSAPLLDRGRLDTLTHTVSYSIEAFQTATGYRPPYALREAIDRIAEWYLAQRGQNRG